MEIPVSAFLEQNGLYSSSQNAFFPNNFELYLLIKWKQLISRSVLEVVDFIPAWDEQKACKPCHPLCCTRTLYSSVLISSVYSKGSVEGTRKTSWFSMCIG